MVINLKKIAGDEPAVALYFSLMIIFAYLLPALNIQKIELVSNYVDWYMRTFPVLELIAKRSHAYEAYRVFFAFSALLIAPSIYTFYKKPIQFNAVNISNTKLWYIFIYTIFLPAIIFLIIFALSRESIHAERGIISLIIFFSSTSKLLLIIMFGSLYMGLGLYMAITFTWFLHFREILRGY